MSKLLADFAAGHPSEVVHRGDETFIAAERVADLLREAERKGVRVLGLEGFIVSDDAVYPALGRIADLSNDDPRSSARRARELLDGPWRDPPRTDDQVLLGAAGRHMMVVVL